MAKQNPKMHALFICEIDQRRIEASRGPLVLLIKLFTDDIGDSLARKPIQDSRDRKRNSNERRIGSTRKLNPERLALTSISKI